MFCAYIKDRFGWRPKDAIRAAADLDRDLVVSDLDPAAPIGAALPGAIPENVSTKVKWRITMSSNDRPDRAITRVEATAAIRGFLSERAAAGVMIAEAFTEIEIVDRVLTATWNEHAIGKAKSDALLELHPYENLAEFIGVPLAFNNEEGRQIRQHVDTVSVVGPFGVGAASVRELYERATGRKLE